LVSTVLPARQGQIVVVVSPDTLMDDEAAQPSFSRQTPITSFKDA
jgi:hypothetical protein